VEVRHVSHWYRTRAITLPNSPPQPDYINGCAILATSLDPYALLDLLLATEQHFGRERRQPWGARTLDLDLLLCEEMEINSHRLTIPHPRMAERAFVLLPLQEIAPHWWHPTAQQTISQLARSPADLDHCRPQRIGDLSLS
jgi:2-amino-4-hydroxy-6-hydroxymethyldihydropteridine diphosphokinase